MAARSAPAVAAKIAAPAASAAVLQAKRRMFLYLLLDDGLFPAADATRLPVSGLPWRPATTGVLATRLGEHSRLSRLVHSVAGTPEVAHDPDDVLLR